MQEKVNCIPPPAVCNVANVPPPPQQQPTPAPLDPAPEVTFTESVCQQETKSDVEAQEQDLDQNMVSRKCKFSPSKRMCSPKKNCSREQKCAHIGSLDPYL